MVNPGKAFGLANANTHGWQGEAELLIQKVSKFGLLRQRRGKNEKDVEERR